MKRLKDLSESRLFKQLKGTKTENETARDGLVACVSMVVDEAEWISSCASDRLHQYTLHEGTHLWNVLSIMEALLPEDTLKQLTPLESALCILAAFTHDLGMVWTDADVEKYTSADDTPEHREWSRHRDGYQEELRQIERWKKIQAAAANDKEREAASNRVKYLEGFLLAEFIRKKHVSDPVAVGRWLDRIQEKSKIAGVYEYGGYPFRDVLSQLAISHGKPVHWMRSLLVEGDLSHQPDEFRHSVNGEDVNLAFPGLLLRLADIMDFDSTRAPGILFRHFGIENETSILEWNKHMAITGWTLRSDELRYEARACGHPVYEKSIRTFVGWIREEVQAVRAELARQVRALNDEDDRYAVKLPEAVNARVTPAKDASGCALYHFHDLQFQLDQHEIQNLLMGESLYGDPTLCVRELLQNALDALELRDIRNQVRAKDLNARVEASDALVEGDAYRVEVRWGKDEKTGREFLSVSDNGAGMTQDQLERYFTKLGKSYYRSPDYERERQIFRDNGHVVSPISQFGIGFLSSFMVTEEVLVSTCPGGKNSDERAPYDLQISGPGSLFWIRPGTRTAQGTSVTLFFKPKFRIDANADRALKMLMAENEYVDWATREKWKTVVESGSDLEKKGALDPFLITGRCVVWPRYAVHVGAEVESGDSWVVDHLFHSEHLMPLDSDALLADAKKWGFDWKEPSVVSWGYFDWVDDQGDTATGSRVRLFYPVVGTGPQKQSTLPMEHANRDDSLLIGDLAALAQRKIEGVRDRLLVKGMFVSETNAIREELFLFAGLGARLWIDLRGTASPRLTADRRVALKEVSDDDPDRIRRVVQRWAEMIQSEYNQWGMALAKPLPTLCKQDRQTRLRIPIGTLDSSLDLDTRRTASDPLLWIHFQLLEELASDRYLDLASHLASHRASAREFGSMLTELESVASGWVFAVHNPILPEIFADDLRDALPCLGIHHLAGEPAGGRLLAPSVIEWNVGEGQCEVKPWPDPGFVREDLTPYDMVFPFSNIPGAELRQCCPKWIGDRTYRRLAVLPFFLLGQEALFSEHSATFGRLLGKETIQAFFPRFELWDVPFEEWSSGDWRTGGLTAQWDVTTGKVLWAVGALSADAAKDRGLPIEDFIKKQKKDFSNE